MDGWMEGGMERCIEGWMDSSMSEISNPTLDHHVHENLSLPVYHPCGERYLHQVDSCTATGIPVEVLACCVLSTRKPLDLCPTKPN